MTIKAFSLALAALLALAPAVAQAQVGPPAGPPPGNIDDRVREPLRPLTDRERDEALTTGDTDLILLRRTRLFVLQSGVEISPTSNAFLAPAGRVDDVSVQASSRLRVGTRIGGAVDVFAEAGIVGVRYFENRGLDYNALTGAVGVSAKLSIFDVALTYQPSIVFDRKFKSRQITQHRLRAEVAAPFAWEGFQIVPSVSGERVLSTPADYENWSYAAEVSLSRPLSSKAPVFFFASGGYERREYDSYFFDFLGVKRNDDLLRGTLGIVWRPRAWADVRASYSFATNKSTSDVNGYRAHSGGFGVTGTLRF